MVLAEDLEGDRGARWRMLHRVRQQILQGLPESSGIGGERQLGRRLHPDRGANDLHRLGRVTRQHDQVHRLGTQHEQALVDAGDIQQLRDQPTQTVDRPLQLLHIVQIGGVLLALRTPTQQLEPAADGRQVVAQIVRQHRHQLVGGQAPALLERGCRRALGQLSAVGHVAYPVTDRLQEVQIPLREGVPLGGLRGERPTPGAIHLEGHPHLRAHPERLPHPDQLLDVFVDLPVDKRAAGLEDADSAPAIGDRLAIEPRRALLVPHRRVAGADRHQRVGLRLMQEGVHLGGTQHPGDQGDSLIHGRLERGGLHLEQPFEGGQQAILAAAQAMLDRPGRDPGA